MSMKNSNDTIGNRTRDLPTCSAVPQPTALRCALHHAGFFCKSNSRSALLRISLLQDRNMNRHIQLNPPWIHVHSQMNPMCTKTSCFFTNCLSIITPSSSKLFLPFRVLHSNFVCISNNPSHASYMPLQSYIHSLYQPNNSQ